MDTKDIVILVLTLMMVFIGGLLLGQRKNRNLSQKITNDKTSLLADEFIQSAVVESTAFQKTISNRQLKPIKDYSRELVLFDEYSQKLIIFARHANENGFYQIFGDQYQAVEVAYGKFNLNKQEATPEEWHELISSVVASFKFGNVVSSIQEKTDLMAEMVLSEYQEHLDVLFKGRGFERLSDRYQLSSDLKAEQLRKISSAIAGKFNIAVTKVRDIEQKIQWLEANYANLVQLSSSKLDIGSLAKNFAGGALAVANPIIGVPLLVANWFGESKKSEQSDAFIDSYVKKWEELEQAIDSLRQEVLTAIEKANVYLSEKTEEIIGKGVRTVLSETATANCSIDHYFSHIKNKALPEIEKAIKEHQS